MSSKKKFVTKQQQLKLDNELTSEEKYRKKLEEVETLKNNLALRKDLAQRSQQACEEWKERMKKAEATMEESALNHRIVSADLSRQYKTMQSDLNSRIKELQSELQLTKAKLEWTESELKKTIDEKKEMKMEKDGKIEQLNSKLASIISQYEAFFTNYMDELMAKVTASKLDWDDKASKVKIVDKRLLTELGLSDFKCT